MLLIEHQVMEYKVLQLIDIDDSAAVYDESGYSEESYGADDYDLLAVDYFKIGRAHV